jgi:hypothetical protein
MVDNIEPRYPLYLQLGLGMRNRDWGMDGLYMAYAINLRAYTYIEHV